MKDRYDNVDEFLKDYAWEHCRCPRCGSARVDMRTLIGFVVYTGDPKSYRDNNSCKCGNCGWSGTVHDLVDENTSLSRPVKNGKWEKLRDKIEAQLEDISRHGGASGTNGTCYRIYREVLKMMDAIDLGSEDTLLPYNCVWKTESEIKEIREDGNQEI